MVARRSEYETLVRRARALMDEAVMALEAAGRAIPDRYRGHAGQLTEAAGMIQVGREQVAHVMDEDDDPGPTESHGAPASGGGGLPGCTLDDRDEWLCLIWEDTRIPDHQVATLLGLSRRRLRHHVQRLGLGARRAA